MVHGAFLSGLGGDPDAEFVLMESGQDRGDTLVYGHVSGIEHQVIQRLVCRVGRENIGNKPFVFSVCRGKEISGSLLGKMELFLDPGESDVIRRDDTYMNGILVAGEEKLGSETDQNRRAVTGHPDQRFGQYFLKTFPVFVFREIEAGAFRKAGTLIRIDVREETLHKQIPCDDLPAQFAGKSTGNFVTQAAHLSGYSDDRHTLRLLSFLP